MIHSVKDETQTKDFGGLIGGLLKEGSVIELLGDVGAGKTTFVKGLALGMGITDEVQSPSFTISRVYESDNNLRLAHYDFYRLNEAGIMSSELEEDLNDPNTVVVIEWGGVVEGVLPEDRLTINIVAVSDNERTINLYSNGQNSQKLLERIENVITS